MYNPEQQPQQLMAPRMSFSSDFALEPPPPPAAGTAGRAAAADADFEFSPAGSRPMMAADQLFSKGRILPLREAAAGGRPAVTLRDELRAHDGNERRRAPRWKELLGLRTKAPKKGAEGAADAHAGLADHGETGE